MEKGAKKKASFLENFIIGGVSGGLSKTISAPLERIKLLLQNQHILDSLEVKYKGNIDCTIRVFKEQGFLSFWRGNMANVVRYIPSFALNFSIKEYISGYLKKNSQSNSNKVLNNMISGFGAASLSIIITYPLDFARTRIGVDVGKKTREFNGIMNCIYTNYKVDGFRGIYAGVIITLIGGSIYRGFYFGFYDSLKIYLPIEQTNKFVFYLASVATTGFAGIVTLPFDTVRRRMMIQTGKSNKIYKGNLDCIITIFKKEGLKGFSKGGYANFLRSFGSAFTLYLNDHVIIFYHRIFT